MIVYADGIILQDWRAQESSQFQETSPKFIPVCYPCIWGFHPPRYRNLACALFLSLKRACCRTKRSKRYEIFSSLPFLRSIWGFVMCFFRAWGMVVCADGVILQDVTEIYLRYIWGFHPPRYQFDRCSFCS